MPKPVGSVNFSAAERERLRELASAGMSRVDAARLLGRSHSMVVRRVHEMGLEWTPPPRRPRLEKEPWVNPHTWTDADDRWLIALAEAGWTQGMAANEMDRPGQTVWRHSKMLGIRWPSGNRSRKGAPVKRPD
jgi:transcriptional regulator with GAF, ATPase, and Fis domain